ncbi:undecaprenyl-phosphate glucose phosphotransferase [Clostridium aminobutyricum]|uniref:Undecaprenyl-phosphate glucose phosphotransferase n=1 Tax=Clostridium aminobutyricum TaxID=33953 RepID=A0A939DA97_CLOAM|nr:undecaprenyl-phosphate glucose phosphotransferase [Clostridium aminobutyricum]MBN7774036.1 undecaprenyl-phosphate glucose phosphotransferase [Clostridium aminobutyricum]
MIKENQKILNDFNILTDGVAILIAMALAYVVRFFVMEGESGHITLAIYIQLAFIVIPLYLLLYAGFGLYESFRRKDFSKEFSLIIQANFLGIVILLTCLFFFKWLDLSRWTLVFFLLFNTMGTATKRYFVRFVLKKYRQKGFNIKHNLIIGSGPLAKEYLEAINKNKALGFSPIGYLASDRVLMHAKYLGNYDQIDAALETFNPDEVVVALEAAEFQLLPKVINSCEKAGTKLCVIPFYSKYMPSKPYMDDMEGIPLINIRRIPLDNILNAMVKRAIDIMGSLCLLLILSPVMIVTAIGTKISSPGPIIFKQERVGLNKDLFTMYKFRSMRVNPIESTAWTTLADPRKTKFGSLIRKFSIDELPQFFNVLKGDMSLVGPRPERPFFVEQFKETIPLYMVKHQVRPGITGWAQVNGLRGDTSIEKRIQHDIYYIENWTILFDIKILFRTLFKGIVNEEKI